jgi:hypothetical protein
MIASTEVSRMEGQAAGEEKPDPFAELRDLEKLVDSRSLATAPVPDRAGVVQTDPAASHAAGNGGATVKEIDERFNDPMVAVEFVAAQVDDLATVDGDADLREFARAGLLTSGAALRKLAKRADDAGQANLAAAIRSLSDFQARVGRAIEGRE